MKAYYYGIWTENESNRGGWFIDARGVIFHTDSPGVAQAQLHSMHSVQAVVRMIGDDGRPLFANELKEI